MSCIKEKQDYLEKNKLIVKIMMLYIDDFYFLFYCLDIEEDDLLSDVEDIVISLIDLQGDNIYYSPLCIA